MKHVLKLTLIALLICSFATHQAQAMDYAKSLFDSNTKKLIWALTTIIITSFATDTPAKLYNFISPGDPEEAQPIWERIPKDVAQASQYDYEKAQRRIIWLNKLTQLNDKQQTEKGILEDWTRNYNKHFNKHFASPVAYWIGYLNSWFKKQPEMLQRPPQKKLKSE